MSGPSDSSASLWLKLVRVLLALALSGAVYLAWVSFQSGSVAGCGPESGCGKVLQSRWAYWLGIPVSVPAVFTYLALLGTTFCWGRGFNSRYEERAWLVAFFLSVMISGSALWFIFLQAVVLKSFCRFCMVAHSCALMATALLMVKAPFGRRASHPASPKMGGLDLHSPPEIPGSWGVYSALAGLAGAAILIAGQLLVEKQLYVVTSASGIQAPPPARRLPYYLTARRSSSNSEASAFSASSNDSRHASRPPRAEDPSNANQPMVQRTGPHQVSIHEGLFNFGLREVPLIGSPEAPHVLVSLYDYTCNHCRDQHLRLLNIQRQLSNQLCILLLVTPLDSNCNPVVNVRLPESVNACDYAQLALAVWRTKREAFAHYDEWLFQPRRPIPVPEARRYAAQLVGADNLERALADPWISRHIQTNGYLYKTNYLKLKNSVLPELMIGPVVSFGPLNHPRAISDLLVEHLGIPPCPP